MQNMQNAAERLNELKKGFGAFAKISPDVIGAFGQMRGACCREGGALDFKTIELICVAVAVARKCEPCILSPSRGVRRPGHYPRGTGRGPQRHGAAVRRSRLRLLRLHHAGVRADA